MASFMGGGITHESRSGTLLNAPRIYIYFIRIFDIILLCEEEEVELREKVRDFPDFLSLLVSIVHRSRQVFKITSCIGTEVL